MSTEPSASQPKKSKKKLIVILAAVAVLLGGGGAGAWFYVSAKKAAALAAAEDGEESETKAAPAKHDKASKPIFTTLDTFTVNLSDPSGARLAQIGIAFEVEDVNVDNTIKDHLPAVRNSILLLLSSKKIDELLTIEGKQALASRIRIVTAQAIGIDVEDEDAVDASAGEKPDDLAERPAGAPGKGAGKKATKKKAPANPIKEVLFSTFLVQ
jgi:flagellar protein FliL